MVPCGEMLVVSVTLLDPPPSKELWSHEINPKAVATKRKLPVTHDERQLLKALDSSVVFINTISNYFETGQKSSEDPPSDASSSSASEISRNPRKTLKKL